MVEEGEEGAQEEFVWVRVGIALVGPLLVLRGCGRVEYRSILWLGEEEVYVVSVGGAWEAWWRKE